MSLDYETERRSALKFGARLVWEAIGRTDLEEFDEQVRRKTPHFLDPQVRDFFTATVATHRQVVVESRQKEPPEVPFFVEGKHKIIETILDPYPGMLDLDSRLLSEARDAREKAGKREDIDRLDHVIRVLKQTLVSNDPN